MELNEPKRKKQCKLVKNLALPVICKKDGSVKVFKARFNGFSVILDDPSDMTSIISMGFFGKASLSRSYPQFQRPNQINIIRRRQFLTRKTCLLNSKREKVIVVPDSDSENEEYFTNLKPKYEIDTSGVKETVWLSLEETFFLVEVVKCLSVNFNNCALDSSELWMLFARAQPDFVKNYLVYFYYKSKGWVVKPGIKFGGDFMLYKEGPPFYHATYIVIIEVLNENGIRNETLTKRPMDNTSLLGLNRLCETAGKELLVCRIKMPDKMHYEDLSNIEVQEILFRRWIASQERDENKTDLY